MSKSSFSFTEVSHILQKLPISYYVGDKVPVEIDEKEESSFFSITPPNKITVSYPQIDEALSNAEKASTLTADEAESLCRSNIYHEVSHAILTPRKMQPTDIINVFEDERIETILKDYYLNVDFKKNIKLMNGWTEPHEPESAWDEFYQTVRYRCGEKQFLDRTEQLIANYYCMDCAEAWDFSDYIGSIYALYNDIAKKYPDEPKRSYEQDLKETENQNGTMSGNSSSDAEKGKEGEKKAFIGECREQPTFPSKDLKHTMNVICEEVKRSSNRQKPNIEQTRYYLNQFSPIFQSFNKKTAVGGSAVNAYNGTINPKAVGRKDYKYFERMCHTFGNNKYGSCKINLFLDVSGSYSSNVQETNAIVTALKEMERKYPFFSMDVVSCGVFEKVNPKDDFLINAEGGNYLSKNAANIFKSLQKKGSVNYNIVLFDGDAFSDASRWTRTPPYGHFAAFNSPNSFIISDYDNQRAIEQYCPSAKKVFINDRNDYNTALKTEITKALAFALS